MNKQLTVTDHVESMLTPHESNLSSLLGEVTDPKKFKAAVIVACQKNTDILRCDPNTIVRACMLCAQDGLIPDGRLAAIVPYNEKRRIDGRDQWVKVANYMPMVAGVLKRARDFSDFHNIVCEVVCENDTFNRAAGDDPKIEHSFPDLGEDRGAIVGSYAIFKDKNNRVIHREVVDKSDLLKVRAVSKAKDKVWGPWEGEMAKKTAIRRGAKRIPMSDELRAIVERDDQFVDLGLLPKQPSLQERLATRQQIEPTDEGFDQSSIQEQIEQASQSQSEPEDTIDEQETPKEPKASEETAETQEEPVSNLTEGQMELLASIEAALSGCRTSQDIDGVANEFGPEVGNPGEPFYNLADKAIRMRRAEIGGGND